MFVRERLREREELAIVCMLELEGRSVFRAYKDRNLSTLTVVRLLTVGSPSLIRSLLSIGIDTVF